ncbi:unnamed protein product [Rhizophagus irregularis]|nr:unnamed protein product [Rhizophagus irregularis]CAB4488138.1 unnamed protein product [Rhizophagus irregularis]
MRLKNVQLMLQVQRRNQKNENIILKYLHNTQNIVSGFLNEAKAYSIERKDDYINIYENITDEFLNEIKAYSMNIFGNILPVYGISQNPDTKDYIMVLGYAKDMGLCGRADDVNNHNNIYGVMPYVAPEVLKGKPYTQAADIYSFEEFLKDDINKYKITDDMSVDFCSLIEESSDQND